MSSKLRVIVLASTALAITTLVPSPASAQLPPACVNQACRKLFFYDGSNNLQYACYALENNALSSVTRAATTLTNIVVSSNVATVTTSAAHKLYDKALVIVSGATVDANLNGSYGITSTGTTTYTFTTVGVADGTYNESTLVISTYSPKTSASVWAIAGFTVSGTNTSGSYTANRSLGFGTKCDDRTKY